MMIRKTKKNSGFFVSSNRQSKAEKIIKVLNEETNGTLYNKRILDIGTGNGEISYYLAQVGKEVISVDIKDNREIKGGYQFLICNEYLPYKNNSFDIVISNHVIEHVSDNKLHLNEINRILKNDGVVYLATPNRLWPWEVHYRLWLLHYLPKKTFMKILVLFKIYHEDLTLVNWFQLKQLLRHNYTYKTYCDKIAREPDKYSLASNKIVLKILKLIPLQFYTALTFINPTLILTLRKS